MLFVSIAKTFKQNHSSKRDISEVVMCLLWLRVSLVSRRYSARSSTRIAPGWLNNALSLAFTTRTWVQMISEMGEPIFFLSSHTSAHRKIVFLKTQIGNHILFFENVMWCHVIIYLHHMIWIWFTLACLRWLSYSVWSINVWIRSSFRIGIPSGSVGGEA